MVSWTAFPSEKMNCFIITEKIIKRNSVKKGPNYPPRQQGWRPMAMSYWIQGRYNLYVHCLRAALSFLGLGLYLLRVFWGSVVFTYMHSLKWTLPLIKWHLNLKFSLTWMTHCQSYLSESILLCRILWVLPWTMRTAVALQKALRQEPSLEQNRRTGANRAWDPPDGHCRPWVSFQLHYCNCVSCIKNKTKQKNKLHPHKENIKQNLDNKVSS